MSIAVSATVYPSRILFGLIAGMCAGLILVAGLIAFGLVGEIGVFARGGLVLACSGCAALAFFRALLRRKSCYLIQVSGRGQIRLSVMASRKVSDASQGKWQPCEDGEPVRLLPLSTLWPCLMVLHFRYEHGRTGSIIILPDSFVGEHDRTAYRALLVACRWALLHQPADYAQAAKFF